MELADLETDEQVALLSLIVQMIGADEGRSPEEMQEFREIADEMGRKAFDDALQLALKQGATRDDALALAGRVERPAAREIMHTVLVDLAAADFIADEERELIRAVAGLWGIATRV